MQILTHNYHSQLFTNEFKSKYYIYEYHISIWEYGVINVCIFTKHQTNT